MKALLLRGADLSEKEMLADEKMAKKLAEAFGFTVEIVSYKDITVTVGGSEKGKILVGGQWRDCPDVVIYAAFRSRYRYEPNAVMRMFESMGVACINTSRAMEIANDKLYSMQVAQKAVPHVRVPKTLLVTGEMTAAEIGEQIGYPVVIKILDGAMGKGVSLIQTEKELDNLLNIVFAAPFGDQILAQEAILSSKGRDLRLLIAGDCVFHAFVRSNENSFRSNVKQGGRRLEYEAPESLKEDAIKIARAIGIKFGSVDFMFGEKEGEFILCEVNTVPGLGPLINAYKNGDTKLIGSVEAALKKCM